MGRAPSVKETTFKLSGAAYVVGGRSGPEVEVRGWVARKHTVGGLVFALIRDGSGYVQVSVRKGAVGGAYEAAKRATKESAVVIRGEVRDDRRAPGGKEVSASEFVVVSLAESWPITKTAAKSS